MLIAGGMTHGTSNMPRHLRCPLAGTLWTRWAVIKPISALKMTAVMANRQRLPHHHPKGFAGKQEREIAEADETLHRLVQRRQMYRIDRWIDDEDRDQQNQWQCHQECGRRFPLRELAKAGYGAFARPAFAERGGVLIAMSAICPLAVEMSGRLHARTCSCEIEGRQVRMKPWTSFSAQSSVFSIDSPLQCLTHILVSVACE